MENAYSTYFIQRYISFAENEQFFSPEMATDKMKCNITFAINFV